MDRNGFRKGAFLIVAVFAALAVGLAAGAQASWSNYYSGSVGESLRGASPMADGGYLAWGYTRSSGAGSYDGWLVRVGPSGAVIWQRAYGGTQEDLFDKVFLLEDGGLLAVGSTDSFGAGGDDVWVLRLDATGTILWQRTYGGPGDDWAGNCEPAGDGGFVLAGYRTVSSGDGLEDVWVFKIDADGHMQWQKTFGGTSHEWANDLLRVPDGFLVAVNSYVSGVYDVGWIIKLDGSGNVLWQRRYADPGGSALYPDGLTPLSTGGYLAWGTTFQNGGQANVWIVRLDDSGAIVWQKTLGTPYNDYMKSGVGTPDGGCILAGYDYPYPSEPSNADAWVVKVDGSGNLLWQRNYGQAEWDIANGVCVTNDGGLLVAGGLTTGGIYQGWLLKTAADGTMDSSCSFAKPSAAVLQGSSATVSDVILPILVSTEVEGIASATVVSSTEATTFLCASPGPCTLECEASGPAQANAGVPAAFSATAAPQNCDNVATFAWDFGDGGTSSVSNPAHAYAAAGQFTWRVTAATGGASCTKTGAVDVCAPASITTPPQSSGVFPGQSATLTVMAAGSGTLAYQWYLGNSGDTSTPVGTDSASYTTPPLTETTRYWVRVSNGCGTPADSAAATVTVCTLSCSADVPAKATVGLAAAFAGSASITGSCSGSPAYSWTFGDGATSTEQNPTHVYSTAGTRTWTLMVTFMGQVCPKMGTITAVNPPVISLMKKITPPFKIVVTGSNLQNGIRVFINGVEWTGVAWKKSTKFQITGGASLKTAVPKGASKTFRFVNPDGGETSMNWSW